MSPKIRNLIVAVVVLLAAAFGINKGCSSSREIVEDAETLPAEFEAVQSAHEELMMKGRSGRQQVER